MVTLDLRMRKWSNRTEVCTNIVDGIAGTWHRVTHNGHDSKS
jgi:hypothetical protein